MFGLSPLINDANGCELKIVGRTSIFVRFDTYVEKCDFYVFEGLATAYELGGDFCDRFVEAIRPQNLLVELDDGMKITIIWNRRRK